MRNQQRQHQHQHQHQHHGLLIPLSLLFSQYLLPQLVTSFTPSPASPPLTKQIPSTPLPLRTKHTSPLHSNPNSNDYDVIIIGSGIGGLSTASCLASTGLSVLVCESHSTPGGAAHDYTTKGYTFESGPSLYAGLSSTGQNTDGSSPNPLSHVFDIIDERPEWITYDRWGTYLPEGNLLHDAVGSAEFESKLRACGGPDAIEQWRRLLRRVVPLGEAIFRLPSAAVRMDAGVALTMGRYLPALADVLLKAGGPDKLEMPFAKLLEEEGITDGFIRNWLDMICFLLQGATTEEAPVTLMAYMLSDFYRPGVVLDYPKGGTRAIVDALVRGVTKHDGCGIRFDTHVEGLVVEKGKAVGVRTSDGTTIRAKRAVVSNADLWSTRRILSNSKPSSTTTTTDDDDSTTTAALQAVQHQFNNRISKVKPLPSFLHLHLGIDAKGLPTEPSPTFPAQWASLNNWEIGVDAPRNLVLVSVASLLDPSLAPDGKHVVHAYVPATEPYANWADYDRNSKEYREAKEEAAEVLWAAVERQIPDVRERAEVTLVGTPLTHERFLRREGGTYGPFLKPEDGTLDGQGTCLDGFFCCGDSTFPGIGMPAVAASGIICANSIVGVREHWEMLDRINLPR